MTVEKCREDFPLLQRTFHGKPLVYLDSAATTQKPNCVIEAEADYYRSTNANVHRGAYALSEEATEAYEKARETVARFLHAKDPNEIIFVRGTTEALNLLATSLGRTFLKKGDRVVTTEMEHHSNIIPWQLLRKYSGVELDYLGLTDDGELDRKDFDRLLVPGTKVTTLAHVSNTLGTLNPVAEVAERARAAGSLVIVDAAQSAPHLEIDVQKLGADFLAFSGHKIFGPTGIGVLWGRKEILAQMDPFMGGGEMMMTVDKHDVTFKDPPHRFEAGTPNVAGAVTLAAALDYVKGLGQDEITAHDQRLVKEAWDLLHETFPDRIRVLGPPPERGHVGVVSFAFPRMHPHDLAALLAADGIAVRSGAHCAQLVMKRFKVSATMRASYAVYSQSSDTRTLVDSLVSAEELLNRPFRK